MKKRSGPDGRPGVHRTTPKRKAEVRRDTQPRPFMRRPLETKVNFLRSRSPLNPQELLLLYRPDLADALAQHDVPSFRYLQICEHLFSRPLRPFSEATSLPKGLRDDLDALGVSTLTERKEQHAPDGTTKFILAGNDGVGFEAVFMPYRARATACISSQIGCPVGCLFCATGAMGLKRNLTVAEIVDQVRIIWARADADGLKLTNLVYMGMGEPLLNLRAVLDSIQIICDPHGLGMAHRSISVSTVGIPAGIRALARSEPQVNLALSLHAADDATRAALIPGTFRHPISEILAAAWEHFDKTGRKLLVEYVLLGGINDSPDDARRLTALLRGHVVAVNLIPWNAVRGLRRQPAGLVKGDAAASPRDHRSRERDSASRADSGISATTHTAAFDERRPDHPSKMRGSADPSSFRAPSPAAVATFRAVLLDAHIEAVVRQSKGSSISAACGQLAGEHGGRT